MQRLGGEKVKAENVENLIKKSGCEGNQRNNGAVIDW